MKNNYSINLNSKPIDLHKIYLSEENIKQVSKNKKSKIINIEQFDKNPSYENLRKICDKLDGLNKSQKIDLVVINGEPISEKDFDSVRIEVSSIKKFDHLKEDETAKLLRNRIGSVLLIELKNNYR